MAGKGNGGAGGEAPEGGAAVGAELLPGDVARGAQAPRLAHHGGLGARKARREHPLRLGGERRGEELECGRAETLLHDGTRGGGEAVAGAARGEGDVGPRKCAEPEMHLGDDAEPAEAADVKLGHVVAGDVLHDAAAGAHDPAVARHHGAAEDVIAHAAEAVAERARRAGGEDRADAPVGAARRIVVFSGAGISVGVLSVGIFSTSLNCGCSGKTVIWTSPVRSRSLMNAILPKDLTWAAQPASVTRSPSFCTWTAFVGTRCCRSITMTGRDRR